VSLRRSVAICRYSRRPSDEMPTPCDRGADGGLEIMCGAQKRSRCGQSSPLADEMPTTLDGHPGSRHSVRGTVAGSAVSRLPAFTGARPPVLLSPSVPTLASAWQRTPPASELELRTIHSSGQQRSHPPALQSATVLGTAPTRTERLVEPDDHVRTGLAPEHPRNTTTVSPAAKGVSTQAGPGPSRRASRTLPRGTRSTGAARPGGSPCRRSAPLWVRTRSPPRC